MPAGATGLYDDLPSFFWRCDSVRTLAVRQTECDLGASRASLLAAALTVRPGKRFEVLLDFQFPAVWKSDQPVYGVGDMLVRSTARIIGDTLGASGLFFRADLRVPTGSKALRPFSNATLQMDAGLETRFTGHGMMFRCAALYGAGGEARQDADFEDDRHLTLAASAGLSFPDIVSLRLASFLLWFDGGDIRNMYLVSIEREVSPQLLVELAGAFEAAGEARVFDSSLSVSFTYRFPPPAPAPKADSNQP